MKSIAKLLLAVMVLCGACDAVGLGGGTGDEGNVNLVGTTWRGTYRYYDSGVEYITTETFNFTSSDRGIYTTSEVGIDGEDYDSFGFYYSFSDGLLTITATDGDDTSTVYGSVAGGVMTLTNYDGQKVTFYKI